MPISVDEIKSKMENTLKIFHDELGRLRTGRATPSLLEPIYVDAYNSKMKISELATVNAPEPKLLTVQVWDKSMVANVEKSIRDSELGLNPNTDGQLIRVQLPDLTEERRLELTKVASKFAEDSKISIRNIRRDAMDKIKEDQKNNTISEDEQKSMSDNIQEITDEKTKEIDAVIENKKKEIMQI
ncbi:MAG: Ribosome-recycling factor [Alphaproteobacteria bacterium MarineAlpha6_Bin6]|nr:ribosome recycling factor [Pelagibacteraceae bacterium]PPR32353.1 MAG: Ribosome-recycling factor [Alphaproteobacteria bacterium MarineAlpha6_Bin6]PPR32961.1 MAG: Ribosome-recycling factor [Alphaproteobacteria bacterium MarineAlpha6_Bin5]|tara:strand:+ start:30 stop:584 length:555 start_codon:yes stop_codon:yes gene_type:complete